jgi:hypothetical protein
MIDHRKLLKDCIRGTIWEYDVPALPGPVDQDGEPTWSSREELELYFTLVAEVIEELGETREFVLTDIANRKREAFEELEY